MEKRDDKSDDRSCYNCVVGGGYNIGYPRPNNDDGYACDGWRHSHRNHGGDSNAQFLMEKRDERSGGKARQSRMGCMGNQERTSHG